MVETVAAEFATRPIVEENMTMGQEFRTWVETVTGRSVIVGTGSPEGVVEGEQTWVYMDDAGTAGNILYIKRDDQINFDSTKGWILV